MRIPTPKSIVFDEEVYSRIVNQTRQRLGIGKPREGMHVSDVIYCPLKQWVRRNTVSAFDETPDEQMFVWVIGRSHEDLLGTVFHGEAQEVDGIIGTPDWYEPEEGDSLLVECKSTRSSARKELMDMAHYVAQAAAYCRMTGRLECCVVVLHIMGDYSRDHPPQAVLKPWRVRFTQDELDLWWLELQDRKALLEDKKPPEFAPAIMPCYEWECSYCSEGGVADCPRWLELQAVTAAKAAKKEAKNARTQPIE